MKDFCARLYRGALRLIRRFIKDQPSNPYEALAFRVVREAAFIYGNRRVIPT